MELPEQDRQALIEAARRRGVTGKGGAAFGVMPSSGKRPKEPEFPPGSSVLDVPIGGKERLTDTVLRRRSDPEASMTALPAPSMAQRHARSLEGYLTPKMGGPRARTVSQSLLGGQESVLPFGIGLQEFVPFSPYVGEEAGAMVREGQETDSGLTTGLGLGMGALQALPVAKPLARGAKAAGKALGPKAAEMAEGYLKKSGLAPELIAYQGSPHKFAPEPDAPLGRLRADKIGTGEGAQAYGYGHYTAEAENVAEGYARNLANRNMANQGRLNAHANAQRLASLSGNPEYAIDDIKFVLGNDPDHPQKKLLQETLDLLESGDFARPLENKGYVYTLDIPDEMIPRMLDWDKPLSQQSKEVQEFAKIKNPNLASEEPNFVTPSGEVIHWSELLDSAEDLQNPSMRAIASKVYGGGDWVKYGEHMMGKTTGEDFYRSLSSPSEWSQQASAGAGKAGLDDAEASAALREAGIPGIRYLDAGSRDTGKGTRNFVVFPGEEEKVKILERKAEGGLVTDTDAIAAKLKATGMDDQKAFMQALRMADARQEAHMAGGGLATLLKGAKPVAGPQAKALETARKNAVKMLGLPENNTAMDRAKAMGFSDSYHGTNRDVPQIDMGMAGAQTGNPNAHLGFFSTPNTVEASRYSKDFGGPQGGNVMPLMVRRGNEYPISYEELNDISMGLFYAPGNTPKEKYVNASEWAKDKRKQLMAEGYDTAAFRKGTPVEEVIALRPEVVRSRFAAFDPARINKSDLLGAADPALLAGVAVGSGLGLDAIRRFKKEEQKPEEQKKAKGGLAKRV